MKNVLVLLLMWFLPNQVSSNLVRNRCKRQGHFREPDTDYSLFGHVISNITVPDVISCSFECLSNQRCLSYNFKETKDDATNICELNDATKDATPRDFHGRPGYKYYDTEKALSQCALSPCLNGGLCVETCLIGQHQITCKCKLGTAGDRCQFIQDNFFNYDITFPNKSDTSFAAVRLGTKITLQALTLCMWIQTIDPGPFHLFSYVTSSGSKELSFGCQSSEDCEIRLLQDSRLVGLISLNDGKWRHICVTWESFTGAWNVYLDGALRGTGSGLGTGLAIHGGGGLVLGQKYENSTSQPFNQKKSFVGNITHFNLWDKVLERTQIKNISNYCHTNSSSIGNVIIWSELQLTVRGQAKIGWNSLCKATVEESRFVLHFPLRSVNNSVVPPLSMPSFNAGTICFWMNNAISNYNVFSYVDPGEVNPTLSVYFGLYWRFYLSLVSPRVVYDGPPLGDSYWHHLCTSWDFSSNEWNLYLDGVPQIADENPNLHRYTVKGGGKFVLGQHVEGDTYVSGKAYQGMLAGLNIWTKRLSARTVAALAQEPGSENGNVVAWTMFREGIMGDVEIYNNYEFQLTARESDYTLNFSANSTIGYVTYHGSIPDLTEFSACVWFKTTASSGELTLLWYTNNYHSPALLWSIIDGKTIQMNLNTWDPRNVTVNSSLADGSWHHVSIGWKKSNGRYFIHVDQKTKLDGNGYKYTDKIKGGGWFEIGRNRVPSTSQEFQPKQFVGEMTRLNMWKQRVELSYAANMGRGCGLWNGNVLPWSRLKSGLVGDVQIIPSSECFIPDTTLQERRDDLCQNTFISKDCNNAISKSFSLFDFATQGSSGRHLRCYKEDALTNSKNHYLREFSKEKASTCIKNMAQELLNITR